jgi:hypothetical protein
LPVLAEHRPVSGDPGDTSEHEPDEPDPEPDEPSLGPEIPEAPTAPTPDGDSDAPPGLIRAFWWLVLVFNAALLLLSVGAMLFVFREQTSLGGQMMLVGALLGAYGLFKYREYDGRDWQAEADEGEEDASPATDRD